MCSQIEISNSHLQFDGAVEICKEECTIEQDYLAMETDSIDAFTPNSNSRTWMRASFPRLTLSSNKPPTP